MDLTLTVLFLSLLAGLLTTLSPCVLPILPIVASSAMAQHKVGLFTLALGMATSFTLVGTVIASLGLALGIHSDNLRYIAAIFMIFVALWLLMPKLQQWIGQYTTRLSQQGDRYLSRIDPDSTLGQLGVGLLLGVVWAPCVGPTLGAAITLASQGESLGNVSIIMMIFSLGAVIPLMIIGLLSRHIFQAQRQRLAHVSQLGRKMMGWSLFVVGVLVLSGIDKSLEAWLVALSPEWLTELTTRF